MVKKYGSEEEMIEAEFPNFKDHVINKDNRKQRW